jgi:radical SAM superfamily enzyme YgiQ (UPF0313 family)
VKNTHSSPLKQNSNLDLNSKILLTSVFGPYAQDDEYGSRKINPMELYHNQVTRVQGPFSLRMFHRSWGLMLIQANISAPCTLLDFPERQRFIDEIKNNEYDIVGISGILPNLQKVKVMCDLIREHLPKAVIVVGGHIANVPDLSERIDADIIAKGEGVRFFRELLGDDIDAPLRHPLIQSSTGARTVGTWLSNKSKNVAATVIPSVGCPLGCNFCSTSAMFGGKGKFINFYNSGDELFDIMCQIEKKMKVKSFFIMDENFLLHQKRALRLLELIKKHDKAWSLNVFSSASVLRKYTMEQLVDLGISWVWMGLEGEESSYDKLNGIDTMALVKEFNAYGIKILGSSIIGLENHTPDNIDAVIDYAVKYNTDFHQFMLYTPVPGTPLHKELSSKGLMKTESEFPTSDTHGQLAFNYYHPHIKNGEETEFLIRAFEQDFKQNGPSILRIARTTLNGWLKFKNHPDKRVARRYAWESRQLSLVYPAIIAASKKYYKNNTLIYNMLSELLNDIQLEFGLKSKIAAKLFSPIIFRRIKKEEKLLANGKTYEPRTFYERNFTSSINNKAKLAHSVVASNQTKFTSLPKKNISPFPVAAITEA